MLDLRPAFEEDAPIVPVVRVGGSGGAVDSRHPYGPYGHFYYENPEMMLAAWASGEISDEEYLLWVESQSVTTGGAG